MRFALLIACLCSAAPAWAGDPATLDAAVTRGLDFLARDAVAWNTEHECASCHHASLVVWAFREARAAGRTVDDPLLDQLNGMMATAGDGKFNHPRPADKPDAFNSKALYFSLALAQNPDPAAVRHDGTKLLLTTVKADQTGDGSWSAWPETRPPIFPHSDECATVLAALTLLSAATAGDAEAVAARDRGVQWLADHPTDGDPQSVALRVILWHRLQRPAAESQPWVELIRSRQNADGGWSQASDMPSDAWATGQALYALAVAGTQADDPVVLRGQQFLTATQREDGGWPMTSRPIKPGGAGSADLVPITGAGAAWGVLGLLRSASR
jgi:squalene-hopene/tetraprenyl-beta-curcumene cyclase